jgi:hypothetical protein
MPTYTIHGKKVTVDRILTDSEIDEIAQDMSTGTLTYTVEAPNGKTYDLEAPAGTDVATLSKQLYAKHPEAAIARTSTVQDVYDAMYAAEKRGDHEKAKALAQFIGEIRDARKLESIPDKAAGTGPLQTGGTREQAASAQVVVPAQPDVPPTHQDSDIAMWGAIAAVLIVIVGPVWGAIALNRKHLRLRPNCQPFAWGYHNALINFLTPFVVAGAMSQQGLDLTSVRVLLFVLLLTYVPLGILTLRRNRTGFLLLTVLQLNPIYWLVNGIYLKNRWEELSPSVISQPLSTSTGSSPPSHPTQHDSATNVAPPDRSHFPKDTSFSPGRSGVSLSRSDIAVEALYEQALNELSTSKKPGLWAMALAQTANGGNPDGAYIALRVNQLQQEHAQMRPDQNDN